MSADRAPSQPEPARPAVTSGPASAAPSQPPQPGDSPQPASQAMDPANPRAIWNRVLADIQNKPAFAWVRSLRLDRIEQNTAHLSLMPGQREMARFFGDRQRTQLAQKLGSLVGRPVKVELQTVGGADDDSAPGDASGPSTGPKAIPGAGAVPGGRAAITAAQRQEVMGLPLVRELMETFDLSLVEVRQRPPAGADNTPADAGDDQDPGNDIPMPSASDDDFLMADFMDDQEPADDV